MNNPVGDTPAGWGVGLDLSKYEEVELVLVHGITVGTAPDTKYLPAGTKLYLSADRSTVWLDAEAEGSSGSLETTVTDAKVRINPASEQLSDLITTLPASTPNLMGYDDQIAPAPYHAFYDPASGVPKPSDGRPVYEALRPDFEWPAPS